MAIQPRIMVRAAAAPGPEGHQRVAFQTGQRRGEAMTLQALQCAVDLCGVGRGRSGTGDHQPHQFRFAQQRQFNRPFARQRFALMAEAGGGRKIEVAGIDMLEPAQLFIAHAGH